MQEILVGILYVFVQLLSEASEGRLKVVYGDALQFNIEQNCSQFVERRSWEDGEGHVLYNDSQVLNREVVV